MALKSTIFKADLQISDLDRHYYAQHLITIARHPSENDERMMVRLLAFMLYASDTLQLCKGLSDDSEPDLWQKSLSDEIELWIELGQPEEKRLRKACGVAQQVIVINYQDRSSTIWRDQNKKSHGRFDNLTITSIDESSVTQLAQLAQRNMRLQCTIQDGSLYLGSEDTNLEITPQGCYSS